MFPLPAMPFPILELRPREGESLVQSHIATKWQSWDSKSTAAQPQAVPQAFPFLHSSSSASRGPPRQEAELQEGGIAAETLYKQGHRGQWGPICLIPGSPPWGGVGPLEAG